MNCSERLCSTNHWQSRTVTDDSVLAVRLAAMGADVDDGHCHLHRLQMAHVAARGGSSRPVLETCRVPAGVARAGRDEFSWRQIDLNVFALPLDRMGRGSWKAHARRRALVCGRSTDS